MKKALSIILCLVMVLSVFAVVPLTADAEKLEAADVSADVKDLMDYDNKEVEIAEKGQMVLFQYTANRNSPIDIIVTSDDHDIVFVEMHSDGEEVRSVPSDYIHAQVYLSANEKTVFGICFSDPEITGSFIINYDSPYPTTWWDYYDPYTNTVVFPSQVDGKDVTELSTNGSSTPLYSGDWHNIFGGSYNRPTLLVHHVELPETIEIIHTATFAKCFNLEEINIPDSVTEVAGGAFVDCKSLKSVHLPMGINNLGCGLFFGCSSLETIEIPSSVESIEPWCFYGCESLKNVKLPDSVKIIGQLDYFDGQHVFKNCTGLESIDLGDGLTVIPGVGKAPYYTGVFYNCTSLKNVRIGKTVKTIGSNAFLSCPSLTDITIPQNVTEIEDHAIGYCAIEDIENRLQPDYYKVEGMIIRGYKDTEAERYANENGFTFIAIDQEYVDDATGISVITNENVSLSIETLDASLFSAPEGETISKAFDITLKKDGAAVQPNNKVTVKIPYDNPNAKVYRVEADGSLTDMNAVWENGYLVYETDRFSLYIVADPAELLLGDADGNGEVNIQDAIYIQRKLAEYDVPGFDENAANVDGNSLIITDATYIQRWLAEITVPYPIGEPI